MNVYRNEYNAVKKIILIFYLLDFNLVYLSNIDAY
jgi:hypothetical protein